MGFVRLELPAIFKSGFAVFKNLSRLLGFEPVVSIKYDSANLAATKVRAAILSTLPYTACSSRLFFVVP
jgi:hypothetical protein